MFSYLNNLVKYSVIVSMLFVSILHAANFAQGADVSWLPQMEAKGVKFYDDNGVQKDCLQILKEHGINALRLRVWVNPSDDSCSGHCSKNEVVSLAKRAADMGFRLMIDFHYSDSWADPGTQTKPAAWANHTITQLTKDVYDHTADVLNTVISNGIHPEWVQVGNETNDGMLWDEGKASKKFANLASLITSGYNAVKAADSTIKVIVHLSNGYDNGLFRWMFDSLKANGAKYDVIGMSLYPSYSSTSWTELTSQCMTNMNDMVTRYGKDVMICEVGMTSTAAQVSKDLITDLIEKVKDVPDGKGLGVFIWEPQSYNWCNYSLGAWDTSGRPTIAMDAFLPTTGLRYIKLSNVQKNDRLTSVLVDNSKSILLVKFKSGEDCPVTFALNTINGKVILPRIKKEHSDGLYSISFNISDLSSGVYYLLIRQGVKSFSKRIVLQK